MTGVLSVKKKHAILYAMAEMTSAIYIAVEEKEEKMKTDILIVGSGCAALYLALKLPEHLDVTIITKTDAAGSDSFLAQGGICMWHDPEDYDAYVEDTMRAGHYENDRRSVELMIRSSPTVVEDLIRYGVEFQKDEQGNLIYTREGAHSRNRILFHADETGREITGKLLDRVRERTHIRLLEYTAMLDLVCHKKCCYGAVVCKKNEMPYVIEADVTVLATGGIGGLFRHSTNYRHLTGDALAIAMKHKIPLEHLDYIQVHPTTLYVKDSKERSFLISESVRGEGALLCDKEGKPFVNALLPRDILTQKIYEQMEKDGTDFVWEDLRPVGREELQSHFPNIVAHCKKMGYDVFTQCIPVVPAQHYFMGGIKVDHESRTGMERLYAVGETACNGVHGKNRLASNSLLESLVFAERAAKDMTQLLEEGSAKGKRPKEIAMDETILSAYRDPESILRAYQTQVREELYQAGPETVVTLLD